MNSTEITQLLVSDIKQIVVVGISLIIFSYVRLACGKQARYFVHLAIAYAGIGAIYVLNGAVEAWFYFNRTLQTEHVKTAIEVIISTLSLVNTAFFATAWYLMRDLRWEKEAQEERTATEDSEGDGRDEEHEARANEPTPTMSNTFVASVIGAAVSLIAVYLGMANLMIPNGALIRHIFSALGATLAAISLSLVGSEFALIRIDKNPTEGSLFRTDQSQAIFRIFTLLLFLAFGLFQFSFLLSVMPAKPTPMFQFPSGAAYDWLAILRILCAGFAVILGLHALPSKRWKHKVIERARRRGRRRTD